MSNPADRLRQARERAGFEHAKDAAKAMGVPVSTYIGHENGSRGYTIESAARYAHQFKVTEEWLLYGKGTGDASETAEILHLWDHMPRHRRREALEILRLLARNNSNNAV